MLVHEKKNDYEGVRRGVTDQPLFFHLLLLSTVYAQWICSVQQVQIFYLRPPVLEKICALPFLSLAVWFSVFGLANEKSVA